MADSNLSISITADAAKLRAELAVAQSSMRAFQAEMNRAATVARKAGDDMSFAKVAQSAAQFDQASTAVAELKTQMEGLGATGQVVAKTFALNRIGMLELQAAGVNSFQALASGMSPVHVAMMEGAQVIGALVQGGVIGFAGLTSSLGIMAGAAIAAVVPLGYLAYQAYETQNSLKSLSTELLLTGRSGGSGIEDLGKAAGQLADRYNLSQRAAADLLGTIAKAHPLSLQQIRDLADIAAAEAKVRNEDPSEVGKRFADRLNEGAKGAIALAQSYNVATTAAEQLLKSGDAAGSLARALADLKAHIDANGGAWAAATAKKEQYFSLSTLSALEGAGFIRPDIGEPPSPTRRPSGGAGLAGSERMAAWLSAHGYSPNAAAGIMGNASVESNFDPNALGPLGHQGLFQWDKSRWAAGGSPAGDFDKQMALMDAELQKLDATFKVSAASVEELAQRFERVFERSGGQMMGDRVSRARGFAGGTTEPYGTREARERAIQQSGEDLRRQEVEYRNSLSEQARLALEHYQTIKGLAGEGTAEEAHAKQELIQKLAQFYDRDTANMIASLRAQQAAAQDISQKISLQRSVIGTIQSRGVNPLGGGVNEQELNAARTELAALERDQIRQNLQLAEQGAAAQRHANADMLRGYNAQLEAAVKLKQLDPFVALDQSAAKSRQLSGENAAKLQELMGAASSLAERTRIYWMQWDEGVRASTELLEIQKRKAEEMKSVMDKWTAPIRSAIDGIGSSFSSALSGMLTGEKTWAGAMREIANSALKGLADSIGSVLSKLATRALGGAAGEGLGDFIGGKALGWIGTALAFERGGIVPSAAGGWALPKFAGAQPALLHGGEMVLPERIAQFVQKAAQSQGGGGGLTYAPTINGTGRMSKSDLMGVLRDHGDELMATARTSFRNGWRPA